MDKIEISIAAFAEFVAATSMRTKAERDGGMVYEAGWVKKPGWSWRSPYGMPAAPDEPAVHITFDETASYCRWRGQRLPTRAEWIDAGYTERRRHPAAGLCAGLFSCSSASRSQ
jgi:formylglycine-generating enzyme